MTAEELYTRYENLVYHVMNKMIRNQELFCIKKGFELVDLEQHGRTALWNACLKSQDEQSFSVYAYRAIEGAYKDLIFHKKPYFLIRLPYRNTDDERAQVMDCHSVDRRGHDGETLHDFLFASTNVETNVLRKIELEEKLSHMTERQRAYILLFLQGYSTTEIADMHGLKDQYGISMAMTKGMQQIDPHFKMSFRLRRRSHKVSEVSA